MIGEDHWGLEGEEERKKEGERERKREGERERGRKREQREEMKSIKVYIHMYSVYHWTITTDMYTIHNVCHT